MHAWSAVIQSWIQMSLIPGRIRETHFSKGTDFATKKSWAAFSKSIVTAGVRSPVVRTGALLLVGSTVARVDIIGFGWIYPWLLSSDESVERIKEEEELDGGGEEWRQLGLDSWQLLQVCKGRHTCETWVFQDWHVDGGVWHPGRCILHPLVFGVLLRCLRVIMHVDTHVALCLYILSSIPPFCLCLCDLSVSLALSNSWYAASSKGRLPSTIGWMMRMTHEEQECSVWHVQQGMVYVQGTARIVCVHWHW